MGTAGIGDKQYDVRYFNENAGIREGSQDGVAIFIDHLFKTDNYRKVLRSAARKFVMVARDREVLDCAFGSPRRNTPNSRSAFEQVLADRLAHGSRLDILRYAVEIPHDAYDLPIGGSLGIAFVGVSQNKIGINSTAFPRWWDRIDSFGRRANAVAGVIGHELMHNTGIGHPVDSAGNQSFDDFVYIYGRCVTQILDQRYP